MGGAEGAPLFNGISSEGKSTDSWPWVEKYRPAGLDDIIAHKDIVSTINLLIDNQKLPHLLFYGPPGTGKTSTVLAVAKRMFGSQCGSMVLELNASDERGIDVVRYRIKEFAGTKKLFSSGVKLIILDEADSMSNDAQFSLRRVIEKYTKNTRFCLICNYVSKIIPALQSRCTRFRFAPLAKEQVEGRIRHIAALEKLNLMEDGFQAVLRLGKGDMRRILNILQATSMSHDIITETNVYLCTGNPLPSDIKQIMEWVLNASFMDACVHIHQDMIRLKGLALSDICQEVYQIAKTIAWPPHVRMYIFDQLAQLEHRLAFATNEELQVASLVGIFSIARSMMTPKS